MDLSMLNEPQRRAVTTTEGPLLVLAGAGSRQDPRAYRIRIASSIGKGRDAAWRILAHYVHQQGGPGNAGARATSWRGKRRTIAWVSTFHSCCARILRRDIEKLGYKRAVRHLRRPTIKMSADARALLTRN